MDAVVLVAAEACWTLLVDADTHITHHAENGILCGLQARGGVVVSSELIHSGVMLKNPSIVEGPAQAGPEHAPRR